MICQSNNTFIRLDCVRDALTFFSTEGEYVISLNTSSAHSLTLNTYKGLPKTGASLMPRFIQPSMSKLVMFDHHIYATGYLTGDKRFC